MAYRSVMMQRGLVPIVEDIEYRGYKFVITQRPFDANICQYTKELKKHGVTALIRVCESNYKVNVLAENEIEVFDLVFPNGSFPTEEIIEQWFQILKKHSKENRQPCVAVHCMEGLGRSPVLVAITLIELGLTPDEAVRLVREKRRGAFNVKQFLAIMAYQPKRGLTDSTPAQSNAWCLVNIAGYMSTMIQGVANFCKI